jgi:hypothetical protein
MRRKKFPSLQFMNRDRMRLLLTLPRNGRSMPLTLAAKKVALSSAFVEASPDTVQVLKVGS